MGRAAIFIDAGYLLAGAHDLLGGTPSRSAYDCDYEALLPALRTHVEGHCGELAFLRSYWYDGARDGIPTTDHRRIGGLPYVKVRLGRLNRRGQQKGVDGLIYRDLTALARAGAIERAYLFTGDEDIRESVIAAQDMGIQVVLLSFKPTRQTGRSAALVREVDEVIVLDEAFWSPHFEAVTPVVPATAPTESDLEECASTYAKTWADGATADEIKELQRRAPSVPKDLYVQLLLATEKTVGSLRPFPDAKHTLRAAFWKTIDALVADRKAADDEATEAEAEDEASGPN